MGEHEIEKRFWAKVLKTSTCWLWTGSRNLDGYGRFKNNNSLIGAHRFSYKIKNGPIPNDMQVLHTCDIPNCVNPEHLFIGTHSDNMQDMYRKKRHNNGKLNLCHPDRAYYAKNQCKQCYLKNYREAMHG